MLALCLLFASDSHVPSCGYVLAAKRDCIDLLRRKEDQIVNREKARSSTGRIDEVHISASVSSRQNAESSMPQNSLYVAALLTKYHCLWASVYK